MGLLREQQVQLLHHQCLMLVPRMLPAPDYIVSLLATAATLPIVCSRDGRRR